MKEKIETVDVGENPFDTNAVLAKIIVDNDGNYHVIDKDGTEGPVCKLVDDGKTIALTKNAANRQWFNLKKAETLISEQGSVTLTFKESKKLGERSTTIPNTKLISYLSEELQAEYKTIMDKALEAYNADKKKPMTEIEKLEAKIAKAKAELEKLTATKEEN